MRFVFAAAALGLALALSGPAGADNDRHGKHGNQGKHEDRGREGTKPVSFADAELALLRSYFAQPTQGHCPPGLAKKDHGCAPPGAARGWTEGKALPAGVATYPLPNDLAGRLRPPAGYSYVRSGADILMLSTATRTVVSAVRDLVR